MISIVVVVAGFGSVVGNGAEGEPWLYRERRETLSYRNGEVADGENSVTSSCPLHFLYLQVSTKITLGLAQIWDWVYEALSFNQAGQKILIEKAQNNKGEKI